MVARIIAALSTAVVGAVVLASFATGANAQGTTYTFEDQVIQGTIDKPEAFYILSPSSLDYESVETEESFLPELYETVEDAPF